MEKYLVTSALPYANGPIHFGHIAGAYLPADIFVRFQRLLGNDIIYICGSDDHGVAITVSAEQAGLTPEQHTAKYHDVIQEIFDKFNIKFDNFSRTSKKVNHDLAQKFFLNLQKNGYIEARYDEQFYCNHCDMFLADRYIVGTCPACGSDGARGDECQSCGKWLEATKIVDPKCKVCGNKPVIKRTKNWYLLLTKFKEQLAEWTADKDHWKTNVMKFTKGYINNLEDRGITRDMKWGVKLPVSEPEAEGKVLYVWFDAPIGYISSTIEWAENQGKPDLWKDYWFNKDCKLVHFIGKDNWTFHTIVFPSMLMGQESGYVLPYDVPGNEFLNLEGRQFSKSTGWYIDVFDFFKKFDVDQIRYYLASIAPETKDSDFYWQEFADKANSDLADNLGNFFTRSLRFIEKYFGGNIPELTNPDIIDLEMLKLIDKYALEIKEHLSTFKVRKGIQAYFDLCRAGNKYFDEKAPWSTRKTDMVVTGNTMHISCCVIKALGILGLPFFPDTAAKMLSTIGFDAENTSFEEIGSYKFAADLRIENTPNLFSKIEQADIDKEIESMKENLAASQEKEYAPEKETITYDDFMKLDIRIGKILTAEKVKKTDKLMKLTVDLGYEKRTLIAGIAAVYKPEEVIGKQVPILVNLAPKKIRGVESKGMVLMADIDGQPVRLMPDKECPLGGIVK